MAEKLNNVLAIPQSGIYEEPVSVELSSVDGLGNNEWVSAFGEISENPSFTPELYFKNNETPYVAYSDSGNSNKITVMKYNGSSLELIGERGFSNEPGMHPYIYFIDGIIHVMFLGTDTYNLKVMKYNGNIWEEDSIVANNSSHYIKLFIDNETPYVAYQDQENKITVKKYNGSSWELVGNVLGISGSTTTPSLFIDNGTPYVAYSDGGNSNKITVKKYNGSSWELVGESGSTGVAVYASLFIDNGTPYVAYQDYTSNRKTTVRKYNGSSWELVGVAGISNAGVVANNQSLLVHNGTPYVVYTENQSLILKKYNGSSWELVGNVFPASVSQTRLIINNNTLYFLFKDGYLFKATIIKHAIPINAKINYLQCEPGFPENLEPMSEYLEPILISNKTEIQTKVVSSDIAYLDSDIVKYRYYITDKTIVELDYISTLSDTINMNDMNDDKPKGLISFYKDDIIIAPEFIDFFIDFNEDGTINIEYFVLYETETEAYSKYLKFENITIIFEQLGGNYMHLGLCELGIAEIGSTDYTKTGDTKESISLEVAVEMQKTTTAEKGNATVEAIFSSQTGKITLTLVPVKKEDLQKYFPHFDGTKFSNMIGQIVPKKKVKLHPIELGNDLSLDVIFGKAIITPKYNKANKDASTIELEIEALFDENDVQFYVGIENDPDYVAP